MSRIPPTPVEVWYDDRWHPGTLRTCEPAYDQAGCSGVVTFPLATHVQTARFDSTQMRAPGGRPGCPHAQSPDTGR